MVNNCLKYWHLSRGLDWYRLIAACRLCSITTLIVPQWYIRIAKHYTIQIHISLLWFLEPYILSSSLLSGYPQSSTQIPSPLHLSDNRYGIQAYTLADHYKWECENSDKPKETHSKHWGFQGACKYHVSPVDSSALVMENEIYFFIIHRRRKIFTILETYKW